MMKGILLGTVLAIGSAFAYAGTADLVGSLTDQLGVTPEQATGGAGAIFDYAQDELSADDFSTLSGAVPGIGDLIDAVPAGGSGASAMMGSLGGLGGMGALAEQFSALGLDASDVQKFLPVVLDYVEKVGGADAMGLLKGLF